MARRLADPPKPALTASQFAAAVEAALMPLADPANAEPMAAYMKGHFPFLGIKTPVRRAATHTRSASGSGRIRRGAVGVP
jgi:hypothetical protein